MQTLKVWEVRHPLDDKCNTWEIRYAESESAAKDMAKQGWGWWGYTGNCREVKLKIFASAQEVENDPDEL